MVVGMGGLLALFVLPDLITIFAGLHMDRHRPPRQGGLVRAAAVDDLAIVEAGAAFGDDHRNLDDRVAAGVEEITQGALEAAAQPRRSGTAQPLLYVYPIMSSRSKGSKLWRDGHKMKGTSVGAG